MKKIIFTFLILFIFSLPANPESEINPVSSLSQGLATKVSLDLRGMDIVEVIKFLSMKGNFNLIATSSVQGRVSLFLRNVTVGDILDIILLTNNLACEKKDSIVTIMTNAEFKAIYGKPYRDRRILKMVKLKYADSSKMLTVLSNIKSDIGKIISDAASGTILLIDIPEKAEEMRSLAASLDLPTVNRVFPVITEEFELSYANTEELEPKLSSFLTEGVGSIKIDERTNKLIVTALPHSMEKIRRIIKAFDAKTRQVMIKAKIVEVTLSDDFYMGVDWSKMLSRSPNLFLNSTFPSSSTGASSLILTVGESGDALALIKSVGDAKIVATPHITVCSGEEAAFMVGTRQAYVTSTVTTGEVTTTTAESVEFIDTGTTLFVTPVINKEGFIKMHIKPEVSSVKEWLETTEGNKIPIVDTSNVETEVLIKDGKTIIVAGLIRETVTKVTNKVPFLGDIPILGIIFRNRTNQKEKKEVIIFLTPHIVSGEEDLIRTDVIGKKRKPPKLSGRTIFKQRKADKK
ncbi:MAG: type II secretion system protein GspD [Candidatus Omnitrophica bacterium]|nr:type II secretion system protein GspD [Candidatus Omnitrophota bacterium]